MIKNILTILLAGTALQAAAVTIGIRPGQLADKLSSAILDSELIIEGEADARDLNALRNLSGSVKILDLSKSKISDLYAEEPVHLGNSTFRSNSLPSYILFQAAYNKIILPESITAIESGALAGSEIEEIVIPEGVTTIGDYAFYGCRNLKRVQLPQSLLSIGRGAFANCVSLSQINLAETGVTALPEECFSGASSLWTLDAPKIFTVGSRAFAGSAIESLDLPEVTTFAPFALADMPNLVIVNVGSDARFDVGTLMNCASLMELNGTPENIPDLFVANCGSLQTDALIQNATGIGQYSIANLTAPTMLLGPHLAYIDKKAFANSVNMQHIDATALKDNIPDIDEDAFSGIDPQMVKLKVDESAESSWKSHPVWGLFDVYSENSTVGVDGVQASTGGITLRLEGKTIIIEAPEPIVSGAVYDTSGQLLMQIPGGESIVMADLSDIPSGICLVSVKTSDQFKGFKIVM